METKELKITPPEGFEIDKENSTFECIKFKPITKRWRDTNPIIGGYYIAGNNIFPYYEGTTWDFGNRNVFATEKQAKSALAMAQISQIMANDERFGGVVTDKEFEDDNVWKYAIARNRNRIVFCQNCRSDSFLSFHTSEQRDLFLEENEDLVKDYLMID